MSELSQLELEAQVIDAEMAGAEFKQPSAADLPSLNQGFKPMILSALNFPVAVMTKAVPFTPTYFNDVALNDIADSLIKVADYENIDLAKIIGNPDSRLGAWIALVIAVGMPSFMWYLAFVELKKTQPKEKEVQAAPAEAYQQPTSFSA